MINSTVSTTNHIRYLHVLIQKYKIIRENYQGHLLICDPCHMTLFLTWGHKQFYDSFHEIIA